MVHIDVVFVNVITCPRCGDHQHSKLKFETFIKTPITAPDGSVFTHYAICPITGEPILMSFVGEEAVLD